MKYGMFSIYDEKAQAYLPQFILPETGMAIRTFGDCVNSQEHQFGKHQADYTLYQIAEFADDAGLPSPDKQTIHNVIELKNPDIETVPSYDS